VRAFSFPRAKHRRHERPGLLRAYQLYKPFLRTEFSATCVYCRLAEKVNGGSDKHGVDHYRPKKKFPALETTYANLFFACNTCNRLKGDYWPAPRHLTVRFIPNPCDHVLSNHFASRGMRLVGRTPAGRQAIWEMDLNSPQALELRTFVRDTLAAYSEKLERCKRALTVVRKKRGVSEVRRAAVIAKLETDISEIETQMRFCTGAV
jgi:hypothetical protein